MPDAIVSEVVALEDVPARLEGRRGADAGPGPKVHVDPRLRPSHDGGDMTERHRATPAAEEKLVGADRVIAVLTELADHPLGVTLDELAGKLHSPKPTVHRALATLRRAGLADMTGRGVYILGDEYLRLAFRNLDGRPETARIQPLLEQLAAQFGETAHYAVLSGRDIVYRAKMDPPQGAVRLTSVIGGRNPAYRTAVGKALLSSRLLDLAQVTDWFGDFPLEQKTPHTLTTPEALLAELEATRRRGFGIDDEENELGHQLRRGAGVPRWVGDALGCGERQRGELPVPALSASSTACPSFARRFWSAWGRARWDSSGSGRDRN